MSLSGPLSFLASFRHALGFDVCEKSKYREVAVEVTDHEAIRMQEDTACVGHLAIRWEMAIECLVIRKLRGLGLVPVPIGEFETTEGMNAHQRIRFLFRADRIVVEVPNHNFTTRVRLFFKEGAK